MQEEIFLKIVFLKVAQVSALEKELWGLILMAESELAFHFMPKVVIILFKGLVLHIFCLLFWITLSSVITFLFFLGGVGS